MPSHRLSASTRTFALAALLMGFGCAAPHEPATPPVAAKPAVIGGSDAPASDVSVFEAGPESFAEPLGPADVPSTDHVAEAEPGVDEVSHVADETLAEAVVGPIIEPGVEPSVEPTVEPPEVLPRALWGARPIDASNAGAMERIARITIHHTGEADANARAPTVLADAGERMRAYQAAHQTGRGWADIGYHFVVDGAGRVWAGRSLAFRGAHAGNSAANAGNIGIAVMGNFDRAEPAPKQLATLARLLAWLRAEHDIPAAAVHTHDDVRREHGLGGTACPGRHLAAWLAARGGAE